MWLACHFNLQELLQVLQSGFVKLQATKKIKSGQEIFTSYRSEAWFEMLTSDDPPPPLPVPIPQVQQQQLQPILPITPPDSVTPAQHDPEPAFQLPVNPQTDHCGTCAMPGASQEYGCVLCGQPLHPQCGVMIDVSGALHCKRHQIVSEPPQPQPRTDPQALFSPGKLDMHTPFSAPPDKKKKLLSLSFLLVATMQSGLAVARPGSMPAKALADNLKELEMELGLVGHEVVMHFK